MIWEYSYKSRLTQPKGGNKDTLWLLWIELFLFFFVPLSRLFWLQSPDGWHDRVQKSHKSHTLSSELFFSEHIYNPFCTGQTHVVLLINLWHIIIRYTQWERARREIRDLLSTEKYVPFDLAALLSKWISHRQKKCRQGKTQKKRQIKTA